MPPAGLRAGSVAEQLERTHGRGHWMKSWAYESAALDGRVESWRANPTKPFLFGSNGRAPCPAASPDARFPHDVRQTGSLHNLLEQLLADGKGVACKRGVSLPGG
jgi:hypothetical protein